MFLIKQKFSINRVQIKSVKFPIHLPGFLRCDHGDVRGMRLAANAKKQIVIEKNKSLNSDVILRWFTKVLDNGHEEVVLEIIKISCSPHTTK